MRFADLETASSSSAVAFSSTGLSIEGTGNSDRFKLCSSAGLSPAAVVVGVSGASIPSRDDVTIPAGGCTAEIDANNADFQVYTREGFVWGMQIAGSTYRLLLAHF